MIKQGRGEGRLQKAGIESFKKSFGSGHSEDLSVWIGELSKKILQDTAES